MTTAQSTPEAPAPVANLHETRKALAASKRNHPATKAAQARKAPAKKAPAKAPARPAPTKAPALSTGTPAKLKWVLDGERDEKNRVPSHADTGDGIYAITGHDTEWRATFTRRGKVVELATKVGFVAAYTACTKHHKAGAK